VENAENFVRFQCGKWLEDGRPIRMNCYPLPDENSVVEDFSRIFYIMEAMCWTHFASKNEEVRQMIANKLKLWIFGSAGILKQWPPNSLWFYPLNQELPSGMVSSRQGIAPMWESAKGCGIPHLFSYYLNHIEDSAELREYFEKGVNFLANPLLALTLGVAGNPDNPWGYYAAQSIGFAGLNLAEAVSPSSVFQCIANK